MMCAVGALIDPSHPMAEEAYDATCGVSDLIRTFGPDLLEISYEDWEDPSMSNNWYYLLKECQLLHDGTPPQRWEEKLNNIANMCGLEMNG